MNRSPVALLGALVLASAPAFATNGYFSHGYSPAQKAMGGAGTALPLDGLIASINPAGMVWLEHETAVGLALFTPIRKYEAGPRGPEASNGILSITPGQRVSHNEFFPIPGFAMSRPLGERSAWGLAFYGNGGMNTEYLGNSAIFGEGMQGLSATCAGSFGGGEEIGGQGDPAGFCGEDRSRAGVDMAILFVAPSIARRLGEHSSVGLEPLFVVNRFAAQGLAAFAQFSNSPKQVSDRGHDFSYGVGYRLGFMTGIGQALSFGASFQAAIKMSQFKDYAGLFAGQGNFDIPQTWNLGLAWQLAPKHQVAVDYQQINYSEVVSVGNPFDSNAFVNQCAIPRLFYAMSGGQSGSSDPSPACLGAATGPGFGWRDMTVYKLGYQYQGQRSSWRVGYSWSKQPIPAQEILFNVLAPGVVEKHYTLGLGWRLNDQLRLDAALMHAPERPVQGRNPLSNTEADLLSLGGAGLGLVDTSQAFGEDDQDQSILLNMKQFELSVGLSWRY